MNSSARAPTPVRSPSLSDLLHAACRTTAATAVPSPPLLAHKRPRVPRASKHVIVIDDDDEEEEKEEKNKKKEGGGGGGECWATAWQPRTGAELAVSVVKQREVRRVLCAALDVAQPPSPARPALVLLSGPPGCGKTALVRVLAAELRCDVLEYATPAGSPSGVPGPSRLDAFRAWLLLAGRSCSLPLVSSTASSSVTATTQQQRKRLLLLEDLPFVTAEQSGAFRACVEAHLCRAGACPLVAVVDEQDPYYAGGAGGAAAAVLQRVASTQPGAVAVAVHAVTDRRMGAVLQRLARAHGLALAPAALAALVRDAHGDVRSALNMLQFATASGRRGSSVSSQGQQGQQEQEQEQQEQQGTEGGRDASLSLFHAVGRVLKAERVPETGALRAAPRDVLAAVAAVPPDAFVDCCLENSTDAFAALDQLCAVLDDLSLADTLVRSSTTSGGSRAPHTPGAVADDIRALLGVTAFMHHHVRDSSSTKGGGAQPKRRALWRQVVRRGLAARQALADLVPALVPADGGTEALVSTEEIEDSDDDEGDDSRQMPPATVQQSQEEQQVEEDAPDFLWLPSTTTAVQEVYPFAVHLPHTAVFEQCSRVRDAVEPRPGECLDF